MNTALDSVQDTLAFITYSEGLKRELRNAWLSDGRQESVAEHSWRTAFMVMVLVPKLGIPIDIAKALKMALIHDLVEIEAGDIPSIHQSDTVLAQKQKDEQAASTYMRAAFVNSGGEEIDALWQEFEEGKTNEARFVRVMDRLEASVQKNQQRVDLQKGAPGYQEKVLKLAELDEFLLAFAKQVNRDVEVRNQLFVKLRSESEER